MNQKPDFFKTYKNSQETKTSKKNALSKAFKKKLQKSPQTNPKHLSKGTKKS